MGAVSLSSLDLNCPTRPSPITPHWVTSGNPMARNAIISSSADGSAYTMVWECTAGTFTWRYDCDETVHILEGSILLHDAGTPVRRFGPGDAVFFPKGAVVHWEVEGYVKKLAFMRQTVPLPVSVTFKAWRRLRRMASNMARQRPVVPQAGLPAA